MGFLMRRSRMRRGTRRMLASLWFVTTSLVIGLGLAVLVTVGLYFAWYF